MHPLKLLGLASAIGLTLAQDNSYSTNSLIISTSAQCTQVALFNWMYNSLNQSPCKVAYYLVGVCTNNAFDIPPLDSGEEYIGPTQLNANACICSSVFFSLLGACAVCQFARITQWSAYSGNCSSVSVSAFPEPIPEWTAVPHWAYMNVTQTNGFNASVAAALGDTPEATPSASTLPSPITTSTPTPPTPSHHPSNATPIAGGVVGGVVFIALLSVIVFYFVRQHQRKVYPAQNVITLQPRQTRGKVKEPIPPRESKPLLYDPNDPSTLPTTPPPVLGTTNIPGNVNPVITGPSFSTTPTAGPYHPGVAGV